MALTESNMLPLGTKAPSFELLDTVSNKTMTLEQLKSDKATVVMFICNHCPHVVHMRAQLVEFVSEFKAKGVSFIAISSNDVENYPADSPEKMKEMAEELHFTFPYLYDESQDVAKAYQAACTPDIYIFDGNLACAYRGRFDGASPGNNVPVNGEDLRQALTAVLNGEAVNPDQRASMGCNIKWKQ